MTDKLAELKEVTEELHKLIKKRYFENGVTRCPRRLKPALKQQKKKLALKNPPILCARLQNQMDASIRRRDKERFRRELE